ncbi:EamA family transporter RarD [Neisseria sp. ZJ106]|uniref:EamA family transporter RarD n=1 Tax=Neisseria lisongii TaxID=2912188 RepID=A0ABY7RIK6_9NEIS|nr:EamA family transporter RarD [Neisseria lisongii]MCF7520899.1 EamA family transporter RarD [Neisseria lisongii]WCL71293.1 EamA family transporter RarD [Neisseria lisongii]
MDRSADEYRQGVVCALGCYLIWGLFPLYWFPITDSGIGADQILAQRICWSAVFAVLVLLWKQQGGALRRVLGDFKLLTTFIFSSLAITLNWLVYLWAITHNHILDASLGYFISPLVNVVFGRIFFGETLNRYQRFSVLAALTGILWLALPAGHLPWVSLLLAGSFGVYGLLRKLAPVDALTGMTLEALLMLPFALVYLGYAALQGTLVFAQLSGLQMSVLIGSGVVTVVPLLLFAAAAKRISMGDLGMVQYLGPSLQFGLGLTLFGEAFSLQKFTGYAWVWLGVALYIWGAVRDTPKR